MKKNTRKDRIKPNKENKSQEQLVTPNPEVARELILNVFEKENSYEKDRKKSLEERASIFIGGIITLIAVYVPMIPIEVIKNLANSGKSNIYIVFLTIALLLILLSLTGMAISFKYFVNCLSTKNYKVVKISQMVEFTNKNKIIVEEGIVQHYYTIISDNREINNEKEINYSKGLKMVFISFVLMLITFLILRFIS